MGADCVARNSVVMRDADRSVGVSPGPIATSGHPTPQAGR
jgi:hypothetical protein